MPAFSDAGTNAVMRHGTEDWVHPYQHPSPPLEASQHGESVVDDAFMNNILAATPMFRVVCRHHVIVLRGRGLRPKGEIFLNVLEESPWSAA